MKFWLSKNGEISLREQLARQIVLAIVSGDLPAHARLPSVREMALRYKIHPNTVSAAYIWLEERGWVETRQGSGTFVRENSPREIERAAASSQNELDELVSAFFRAARTRGFSRSQIAEQIKIRLARPNAAEILLVEPDAELRRILAFEIEAAIDFPVTAIDVSAFANPDGAIVVALDETAKKLPPDSSKMILRLNSVQNEMRGKQRPAADDLIGVCSGWETFLRWSRTMLVAAGINAEQLIVRDAKQENWRRGLESCAFVIADSLTARRLPKTLRVRVFQIIAADSLNELRSYVE